MTNRDGMHFGRCSEAAMRGWMDELARMMKNGG